jgi:Fe-S cluster biogenesis protein NfuA
LGACVGCESSNDTIQNSVEAMLLEEVPGVIGVENMVEDQEGISSNETW